MSSSQIWFGIFIIFLLVAGYWLADQFSFFNAEREKQELVRIIQEEIVLKRPTCPSTTEAYFHLRNSGKIITIAKDLNSYGENNKFVRIKTTAINSSGAGSQVACGYLYIKAHGSGDRQLQTLSEHPYVNPSQFGGHLVLTQSIIPHADSSKYSEFLFNLSKIQYRMSKDDNQIRSADWAALLNVSDRIIFESALNTTDKGGVLDEVSIIYQCWNPETGLVTPDCQLIAE